MAVPSPDAQSPCQQVQEAQRGWSSSAHSARGYPVFLNNSFSSRRMSPRGSPRQSCAGQKKLAVTQGLKDVVYKAGKKSPPMVQCSVPRPSSFQPRQDGWVSHKSLSTPFIRQPEGLLLSDARHLLPPHVCFLPAREREAGIRNQTPVFLHDCAGHIGIRTPLPLFIYLK